MSSLEIREARENIINYLNKLPFPLEVKRLVVKEILSQIDNASEQEIISQIRERDEQEKSKEEKEDENEVKSDDESV